MAAKHASADSIQIRCVHVIQQTGGEAAGVAVASR